MAEAAYLVAKQLGTTAEASFLRELAGAPLELRPLHVDDLERVADLVETYADLRLGTVDASVVATAERLGATVIATLDRRHFTIVRPNHVAAFEIVP